MAAKNIGELMVREQLIDINQLEQARREQKNSGGKFGSTLVKLGYITESQLVEFLSKQYGVPPIDLSSFEIDPEALKTVSRDLCIKHTCIPVSKSGRILVVAMADPSNMNARDDLMFITQHKVEVLVASENAIAAAIEKSFGQKVSYESIMTEIEKDSEVAGKVRSVEIVDLDKATDDAPVIKFVNLMLTESIKMRASDIHIEPYEKRFRVRFRVDGSLYEKIQPAQGIANAVVSRIKIMAKLDISEKRRPQDGRLKIALKDGREIDFRVSVLPTLFGEKVVLRLLDKSNLQLDMTKLGFEPDELATFKDAIHQPYGMILITGPTGSGKSTTIYSALAELNQPDVNIATAEDPVEFNLEGINQVQMNADVDLNFAAALRSFLRQDPDVIMVGEIRDYETAEIAFKASLTGHLVVSTLHTNDAPSTINRLLNMGMEPFLVTSAVSLVVAQRLVRKLCQNCKQPLQPEPKTLLDMGVPQEEIAGFTAFAPNGCPACNNLGYKGRLAIYEVMRFTDEMKQLVFQSATPLELKAAAIRGGMRTLRMNGIRKVRIGMTSIEEVIENTARDSSK